MAAIKRSDVFVGVVALCGIGVIAHSAAVLVRSSLPGQWVLFAILTIASGMVTVKIPSVEARFSISEAFAFASVLLFGPDVGAVTLALDALRISVRWKMNVRQTAFNFATIGLSMWLGGTVFFAASGLPPLYGQGSPSWTVVVYLGLMTAVYFAVNSGLMATVVGMMQRRSIVDVWRNHYWPLLPSFAAGASVALLLVVAFRELQFTAVALIVPLLVVSYLTVRSSFGRLEDAKAHVAQLNRLLLSTVETLASAIDAKDEVTHDHIRRVQQGALALARELGITGGHELQALEAAALLHDTGKIAIPEHILNKPGRLTPAEFARMKRHAPIGAQILSSIEFPYPVVPIVRHHHENWDGSGYPDGLAGEEIPLGARILSVVDCFDALTSDRPYRKRMSDRDALQIIRERSGSMYDPRIVDTFVTVYDRIMPADSAAHPAARVIEEARALDREAAVPEPLASAEVAVGDGVLAVASLARALNGEAQLADIGSLLWMILPQLVPCHAFAIFMPDEAHDRIAVHYAAGQRAAILRGVSRPMASGIAGWVAVNKRAAVNADPALDLGMSASTVSPALRSCLALPIVDSEALIAVLAFYSTEPGAFSDDHVRLFDLIAPRLAPSLGDAAMTEADGFSASVAQPLRLVRPSAANS